MTNVLWTPLDEMNLDDGTHTCYYHADTHWTVYLTQIADDTWDVDIQRYGSPAFTTVANCKTLTSAKRYAARYLL